MLRLSMPQAIERNVIEAKKIKSFEKEVTRLVHLGEAGRWVALVDTECRMTLLCEVIKAGDRDYMRENYGYDIDWHFDEEPTKNLLLIIKGNKGSPNDLLHAFESGRRFSLSEIPELENFYLNSDDVNVRGLGRRWRKPTPFELFYTTALLVFCYVFTNLL